MSAREQVVTDCAIPELTPAIYARWRASELGAITERLERKLMCDLIGDVGGKAVLEIGCGDGEFAVALAERGARVVAIDASADMIIAARKRAADRNVDVDFRVATAQAPPYDDDKFDIVVAMTILCFVKNAAPVFQEVARVLRPGGRLIIGELGKRSSWAIERRLRAWLGSRLWRRGVFRTPTELKILAQNAGLVPADVQGAVYYPRWVWAARLVAPHDDWLRRRTHIGAAFLALVARRPAKAD